MANAKTALAAATRNASKAHTIYICELTAECHLPQGEITGVAGPGPQTTQDFLAWRAAVRQQDRAQRALAAATATAQAKTSALRAQAAKDFPLNEAETTDLRARLAEQVLKIHDIEAKAVEALKAALK